PREPRPAELAGAVDGIEGPVGGADVHVAVAVDDGRAEDPLAGLEGPWLADRVRRRHRAASVLMARPPELRPRTPRIERHVVLERRANGAQLPACGVRVLDAHRSLDDRAIAVRQERTQLHGTVDAGAAVPVGTDHHALVRMP